MFNVSVNLLILPCAQILRPAMSQMTNHLISGMSEYAYNKLHTNSVSTGIDYARISTINRVSIFLHVEKGSKDLS